MQQLIFPHCRSAFQASGRRTNLVRTNGFFKRPTSNKAHPNASPPPPSSSSSAPSPSILSNPLTWYIAKLDTHPMTTKCITSGIISGSGDLLCQYLSSKQNDTPKQPGGSDTTSSTEDGNRDIVETDQTNNFDWLRTLRFTILGSFLVAPTVHAWYGYLMSSIPGTGISAIGKRLFCDQILFAPLFLPTFLSCLTVLEHVSPGDGRNNNDLYTHLTSRLKNDVPEALVVGWSIWIPSMAFMFAFVPMKFQVLYSNGIGFVWNAYLSWKTHEGEEVDAN